MFALSLLPLCLGIVLLSVYLCRRLYYYRFEQYASWSQPQSSLLWGHLKLMHEAIQQCPPSARIDVAMSKIWKTLGKPPAFILDLRPLGSVVCVVASHEVAEQCVRPSKRLPYGVPRSHTMDALTEILGKGSIILHDGLEWKKLRKRYSPGFAPAHLVGLLPIILNRTERFLEHIDEYAQCGEQFLLSEMCNSLVYEIIYAVAMGVDTASPDLHHHKIRRLYRALVETYYDNEDSIFPTDPRVQWRRRRLSAQLDSLIKKHIEERFFNPSKPPTPNTPKSIISMSLLHTDDDDNHTNPTPELLQSTADQIKTFLFAGQDTTSTLLQWTIYELSRTPRALQAVRNELTTLFGEDPAVDIVRNRFLADGASLLSRMTYTSAVIKETLRLHPPGATTRMAAPGSKTFIRLPTGDACIDGLLLFNCLAIIQRDETVYGATSEHFLPERWLGQNPDTASTVALPPSAWRPFERGPRACIGQELATIEARVVLACVLRRYEFAKVGLGQSVVDRHGEPVCGKTGQYETLSELYDSREVTFKPVDGMRMRVRFAQQPT